MKNFFTSTSSLKMLRIHILTKYLFSEQISLFQDSETFFIISANIALSFTILKWLTGESYAQDFCPPKTFHVRVRLSG